MYFQAVQKLDALLFATVCIAALFIHLFNPSPSAKAGANALTGPNKGTLISLTRVEYQAEVVLDEATHSVSIYLLDRVAKNNVPIRAKVITVSLERDAKHKSFNLIAMPQKADPAGKSSRFRLNDKAFVEALNQRGSEPRLVLKIDCKKFSAKIDVRHICELHPRSQKSLSCDRCQFRERSIGG